jgi:hypothetical protein
MCFEKAQISKLRPVFPNFDDGKELVFSTLSGQDPQLSAGKHRPNTTLTPLNTELNPIYHFLSLLGSHQIRNVSRMRVKLYHGSQFATEFKEG